MKNPFGDTRRSNPWGGLSFLVPFPSPFDPPNSSMCMEFNITVRQAATPMHPRERPALPAIVMVPFFFLNCSFFSPQKGAGYHLDLLLVAIIIGICSLLGLPWVVAATVLSVGHVQSLFVESQCTAPGEKVQFLGVRYVNYSVPSLFFLCQMVTEHYLFWRLSCTHLTMLLTVCDLFSREQRVTGFFIFLLIGLTVFLAPFLKVCILCY